MEVNSSSLVLTELTGFTSSLSRRFTKNMFSAVLVAVTKVLSFIS